MSKDLLLEIGTEEIPAHYMPSILGQVKDLADLVRGATHLEARQLAVQRLDDDQRLYNRVLETLGCSATRPTAL